MVPASDDENVQLHTTPPSEDVVKDEPPEDVPLSSAARSGISVDPMAMLNKVDVEVVKFRRSGINVPSVPG